MILKNKIEELSTNFYSYEKNNVIIATFWNSLYIAFFLLPLGINLPTPFFIISIILGIINIFSSDKKYMMDNKVLLLFPLYFIVISSSLVYSDNISDGLDLVQRSLSLFLFPIIFLFVKEDASSVKKLFDFLLYGLVVSFFINLYIAVDNIINTIDIDYNFLINSITAICSDFVRSEFSKLINPSYLSLYILLVLSYYLKKQLNSALRTVVVSILFIYLFLLASRAAYLILFFMSVILLINITDKNRKYILYIVFVLGLVIFLNNPRVFDFYKRVKGFEKGVKFDNSTSEKSRLLTWNTAIKLIKEAPYFGYGIGDANDVLLDKYQELGYQYNYDKKYNAHNQFFQTLLQTGILGFSILFIIFILLAIRMKRSGNEFSVFLILFISLLFESMLVRYNGIVFFSIIVSLLLKKRSILSSRIIRNN